MAFVQAIQLREVKGIFEYLAGFDILAGVTVDDHSSSIEFVENNARREGGGGFGVEAHFFSLYERVGGGTTD